MTDTKKVVKKVKKVNPKEVAKNEIMQIISDALENAEIELSFSDGVNYGMTKGTLVVHHANADVQIKPISPKSGLDRYAELVEED